VKIVGGQGGGVVIGIKRKVFKKKKPFRSGEAATRSGERKVPTRSDELPGGGSNSEEKKNQRQKTLK